MYLKYIIKIIAPRKGACPPHADCPSVCVSSAEDEWDEEVFKNDVTKDQVCASEYTETSSVQNEALIASFFTALSLI